MEVTTPNGDKVDGAKLYDRYAGAGSFCAAVNRALL